MEQQAFTIPQFLNAYPISRAALYKAWKHNRGPRRAVVGRRVLIPRQAAEEWLISLSDDFDTHEDGYRRNTKSSVVGSTSTSDPGPEAV